MMVGKREYEDDLIVRTKAFVFSLGFS